MNNTKISGVGGWLLLLAAQVYAGPLITMVMANNYPASPVGELLLLVTLVPQFVLAILLFRRRRRFVMFYKWIGCYNMFVPILYFVVSDISDLSIPGIRNWIVTIVVTSIWILYLSQSRRVANTFVC